MKKEKILYLLFAVVLVGVIFLSFQGKEKEEEVIKIGIITDLTGQGAYWGESTRIGAEMAARELREEGYKVNLIFEDYRLDTIDAINAAQKLINIDKVNAIYADFNPGAVAIGSLMKDKDTIFMYAAAVVSPLEESPYTYKTYLDFRAGCRTISERLKEEGIDKPGLLKLNWEAGELCSKGVKDVYGEEALIESYNFGESDFKTQLTKLITGGAQAIMSPALEEGTLITLKNMRELGISLPFGTVQDTLNEQTINQYSEELKNGISFGMDIDREFSENISGYNLSTKDGAALAYVHVKQLVKYLTECGNSTICTANMLDQAGSDNTINFRGFENRIADLEMKIERY